MGFLQRLFGKKDEPVVPAKPQSGSPEFDAQYIDNMLWAAGDAANDFAPQLYQHYMKTRLAAFAQEMPTAKIVGVTESQVIETWDAGMVQGRQEIEDGFREFASGIGKSLQQKGVVDQYDALVKERVDIMVAKIREMAVLIIRAGLAEPTLKQP